MSGESNLPLNCEQSRCVQRLNVIVTAVQGAYFP